jgi:hypothetical protein
VLERLLNKHEALSSNSRTVQKKKKMKKGMEAKPAKEQRKQSVRTQKSEESQALGSQQYHMLQSPDQLSTKKRSKTPKDVASRPRGTKARWHYLAVKSGNHDDSLLSWFKERRKNFKAIGAKIR